MEQGCSPWEAFCSPCRHGLCLPQISGNTRPQQIALWISLVILGTCFATVQTCSSVRINLVIVEEVKRSQDIFGPHGGSGQANAFIVVAYSIGAFLGPFLGGWFLQQQGWAFFCYFTMALCSTSAILMGLFSGVH